MPREVPDVCGRYTIKDVRAAIAAQAKLKRFLAEPANRFNASPSQVLPVVRKAEDGERELAEMRWGLVPFWDKSEKPKIAPINARAEDALSKPTFKQSLQRRRCLVLADGFYEWQKLDPQGKVKVPFHIRLRGGVPFSFAGIYEGPTDTRPATFAILTTKPNELMERIHNRMPVILSHEAEERWLAAGALDAEELGSIALPYPADAMEAFPVSRLVNNPRNDVPECAKPVEELRLDLEGGPNSA